MGILFFTTIHFACAFMTRTSCCGYYDYRHQNNQPGLSDVLVIFMIMSIVTITGDDMARYLYYCSPLLQEARGLASTLANQSRNQQISTHLLLRVCSQIQALISPKPGTYGYCLERALQE